MAARPPLVWQNTPEFAYKILEEFEKYGECTAYVSPEVLAESRRSVAAQRNAARRETRAKKKATRT